ncbi:MAG: hypothetical protein LBH26_05395 [Treponema sp.]|jgi:hypothetical protein|nr:hypothetical protein [Treponema sp.]
MKKPLVLTEFFGFLLIAGMIFTACPMDSGGDGGRPKPEDLPELPDGINYVASQTEAMALLNELRPGFSAIGNQVEDLIKTAGKETADGYSWKIANDTSISDLYINSEGRPRLESQPANFMDAGYVPQGGDYVKNSFTMNTTVEFTADRTTSGAVVYKGSSARVGQLSSSRVELKETEALISIALTLGISDNKSEFYSLTASHNQKGGKIILETDARGSLNADLTIDLPWDGNMPELELARSGSLKVFGADNELLYELPITDITSYERALTYFR